MTHEVVLTIALVLVICGAVLLHRIEAPYCPQCVHCRHARLAEEDAKREQEERYNAARHRRFHEMHTMVEWGDQSCPDCAKEALQ